MVVTVLATLASVLSFRGSRIEPNRRPKLVKPGLRYQPPLLVNRVPKSASSSAASRYSLRSPPPEEQFWVQGDNNSSDYKQQDSLDDLGVGMRHKDFIDDIGADVKRNGDKNAATRAEVEPIHQNH